MRIALADEPAAAAGDLRWVISTDDDPTAVDQRSTNWTRLGADATWAYYRGGQFDAVAGSLHLERFGELEWEGDIRDDLKAPPVLDGDIPTTLPRAPGSRTSPPSQRAVTSAFDASLTDGAQAWGPEDDYDAAASLTALASGEYWRNAARELVIDPPAAHKAALLRARIIRLGASVYGASVSLKGDAVLHIRSAPVPVGTGTSILRISPAPAVTGLRSRVRVETSDPPAVGSIVSFLGVTAPNVSISGLDTITGVGRYKVARAGSNWFEIYEWRTLTLSGGRGTWFNVAVGGFTGVTVQLMEPSPRRFFQWVSNDYHFMAYAAADGDLAHLTAGDTIVSVTGFMDSTAVPSGLQDPNELFVVRVLGSATTPRRVGFFIPSTTAGGIPLPVIDTTHATRVSVHVARDLPAAGDLPDPLPIRFPDRLSTARGIAALAGPSGQAGGSSILDTLVGVQRPITLSQAQSRINITVGTSTTSARTSLVDLPRRPRRATGSASGGTGTTARPRSTRSSPSSPSGSQRRPWASPSNATPSRSSTRTAATWSGCCPRARRRFCSRGGSCPYARRCPRRPRSTFRRR